ncbi:MAG: InlB B-repeat-containing protein, partial [Ruminococcus sp.]|nr:InlB B-repeat-containing protein [Ruminococcus sp.]
MINIVKRAIACFTAVIMLLCAMPVGNLAGIDLSFTASAAGGVKAKLDSFISSYPNGSRWTGSFDGGSQCYGFGKLVIYNIFGKSGSYYRSWSYAGVSTSGMNTVDSITNYSATSVKNLLSKAKCGDILQFNTTKQHTMIVYSVESDGVWIYDCNWDNNCGISLRKSSFGAWSGRNSTKLTLLHSNNYDSIDGQTVTHIVDSNYGKNFTAYLKNPNTNHTVFDSNHNSTSHYVNGNDSCTIHEVYTDGCCYFTYKLDNGGTRSAYGKISWFNTHTHDYDYTTRIYEPDHPHRISIRCKDYNTCGGWKWTDEYYTSSDCSKCWNLKLYSSVSSLSFKVNNSDTAIISYSGVCPSTTKIYFEYDSSIISYTLSKGTCTFTGLKSGNTQFTVKAYSNEKTKSDAVLLSSVTINITVNANTYTIKYDANGGSGAPSSQTKTHGVNLILSTTKPTRTGYTFLGWSTSSSTTSATYSAGGSYTSNSSAT